MNATRRLKHVANHHSGYRNRRPATVRAQPTLMDINSFQSNSAETRFSMVLPALMVGFPRSVEKKENSSSRKDTAFTSPSL